MGASKCPPFIPFPLSILTDITLLFIWISTWPNLTVRDFPVCVYARVNFLWTSPYGQGAWSRVSWSQLRFHLLTSSFISIWIATWPNLTPIEIVFNHWFWHPIFWPSIFECQQDLLAPHPNIALPRWPPTRPWSSRVILLKRFPPSLSVLICIYICIYIYITVIQWGCFVWGPSMPLIIHPTP